MIESKKKKVILTSRRQLGGNLMLDRFRQQSKRLGHPSRQIKRPKKYKNTSSSDVDKTNTNRDDCLNQSINIENNFNEIRDQLNINEDVNKENEVSNIHTPSMINDNSSDYLINPVRQLHTPLDVTTAFEQYSPQKTYTELLPRKSQSNVNEHSFPHPSFHESLISQNDEAYHHRVTSTITSSQAGQAIYKLSQQNPCAATIVNQQKNYARFVPPHQIDRNNFDYNDNGSQDKIEIRCLQDKLNNVVSKEEFQSLRDELKEFYKNVNNKLDKLLRTRTTMPLKPPSFPLQSVQEVTDFNNISQEEYENVVQYLHFVGGFTLRDTIKYCMKEVMTDDTIRHYSTWGERGNLPLFDTKLVKAIYDAACMNSHYERPLRDEFFREVAEAVRFGKQRNRNIINRTNQGERGRRQRLRDQAENLLRENADNNNY